MIIKKIKINVINIYVMVHNGGQISLKQWEILFSFLYIVQSLYKYNFIVIFKSYKQCSAMQWNYKFSCYHTDVPRQLNFVQSIIQSDARAPILILNSSFIEIQFTYYATYLLKVCNSMVFSVFAVLCNNHHINLEYFHCLLHPNPLTHQQSLPQAVLHIRLKTRLCYCLGGPIM